MVTNRQKELGVCVANIGASTTSLVVFEEGDVAHTVVLPIGGDHVTSDIAIGLRTSLEVAEEVKLRFATCAADDVSKKEEIHLGELGAPEGEVGSRRFVADIAKARMEEIFEMIDKELKKIERSGMLPAGMILTGGGAKLPSTVDVAKRALRLPATIGTPIGVSSVIDRAQDPAMSTAIGLVLWGKNIRGSTEHGMGKFFSKLKGLKKVSSGLKKIFQSLRP